jgi:hypothetical protein
MHPEIAAKERSNGKRRARIQLRSEVEFAAGFT